MFIIISVLIEDRQWFLAVYVLCVKYCIPEKKKSTYFKIHRTLEFEIKGKKGNTFPRRGEIVKYDELSQRLCFDNENSPLLTMRKWARAYLRSYSLLDTGHYSRSMTTYLNTSGQYQSMR